MSRPTCTFANGMRACYDGAAPHVLLQCAKPCRPVHASAPLCSLHISLHQMQVCDRPIFHVAPPSGWANDPNGPLFWRGRYHLFYQHVPSTTKWGWGLCWGHASSSDLVYWQHHPPALRPTPGGFDADGCFSGCAVVVPRQQVQEAAPGLACAAHPQQQQQQQQQPEERHGSSGCPGIPVLLYTGVVRRPDAPAGLRPSSLAVSELCHEQQLAAVAADPDDPFLTKWVKLEAPVCREPPPGLCLNCFRDPFVLERPSLSNNSRWRVMLGAGLREPGTGLACAGPLPTAAPDSTLDRTAEAADAAEAARSAVQKTDGAGTVMADAAATRRAARGTALVYSTGNLLSGWQYEGLLCTARDRHSDGPVWECPLLLQLPAPTTAAAATQDALSNMMSGTDNVSSSSSSGGSGQAGGQHSDKDTYLFSVSVGKSPAIYWTGAYSGGRFGLGEADGPCCMDLGDLLYAPNVLTDDQGRTILWAWLSELPAPASHSQDYAGSLSLPRLLSRGPGGTLHQAPLPQLQQLATQPAWQADSMLLPGPGVAIRHVGSEVPSSYFSLCLTLAPASTPSSTGPERAAASAAAQGVQLAGFLLPAYSFTAKAPADSGHGSGASAGDGVRAVSSSGQGLIVLYDFSSCQLSVVVGPGAGADLLILQADPDRQSTDGLTSALKQYIEGATSAGMAAAAGVRVLGGKLRLSPGQPIELQAYMDHSLFELFVAGCGQTLSTRVYRRTDDSQVSSSAGVEAVPGGVWLMSQQGVEAQGVRLAAMQSIWR